MKIVKLSLIVLVCMCAQVFAGSLEPPAGPDSAASAMYSIEAIYQRLSDGTDGAKRTGGFREPTGPPGSTMHNLNDVMAKAPSNVVDAATTNDVLAGKPFWGLTTNEWGTQTGALPTRTLSADTNVVDAGYYVSTNLSQVDTDLASANIIGGTTIFGVTGAIPTRTLSPDTNTVEAGYYAATNLSEVDIDLTSTNIRVDVTIFGVTGANYACFLPKTGQTNSYLDGDDGEWQKGISWPVPRFTIGTGTDGTNLVTDNMTGLMWARNANMWGNISWTNAITNCNSLVYGGHDDWRLPNLKELYSLIRCGYSSPAVPNTSGTGKCTHNDPFINVQNERHWTSSAYGSSPSSTVLGVFMGSGIVYSIDKATEMRYTWPVRGGL